MSFRKRNVRLSKSDFSKERRDPTDIASTVFPGARPSPLDGRLTISTGTKTLDELLAGHAGLPLGHSVLIEENGITDFAGTLLRYFAAEGAVQGHYVHVVGMPERWGRDLPGLIEDQSAHEEFKKPVESSVDGKMKIAWRYERLGEFGASSRGGITCPLPNVQTQSRFALPPKYTSSLLISPKAGPLPNRATVKESGDKPSSTAPAAFCHTFDLTKRLTFTPDPPINYIPISTTTDPTNSPYTSIITTLSNILSTFPPSKPHRLIIPSLLSPLIYPSQASLPTHLLPFLQILRSLLRRHPQHFTAMLTLPLSLHPRVTGLVRWIEHLTDGVLELAPFPHSIDVEPHPMASDLGSTRSKAEEKVQGILKIHKLPVLTEKGGGSGAGNDMAFSLSRKKFVILPFHLPPVEGDSEAQRGEAGGALGSGGSSSIDF